MADVTQVERQLYILSLLSENKRGYTINEIINKLNNLGIDVSRKTVERDIDCISSNFFVYEEVIDGRTHYVANKYSIKNITFTIAELISLHFAREVLSNYSAIDVGDTAHKIIDKIISTAPQINKAYIDTLSDMMKINLTDINIEKDLDPEHLNIIREAIAGRRKLLIGYYAFNSDETTEREFSPYLLEIYEGCYHLIGYCHLRNAVRNLRVSRIEKITLLDETFERRENFYEEYKENRFEKLSGDEKVNIRLKFKGVSARLVKEYEANKADRLVECEDEAGDGVIIFERNVPITPEVIKWVLGFGCEVEVIEPKELKDEIRRHAEGILKKQLKKI